MIWFIKTNQKIEYFFLQKDLLVIVMSVFFEITWSTSLRSPRYMQRSWEEASHLAAGGHLKYRDTVETTKDV